ncbi:MAG: SRPBCC family protein [Myxococcota bacterium]|nr:SRPBCC family protein [Myxococcota bacterium]
MAQTWHDLRKVGLEFIDEAPRIYCLEAPVAFAVEEVWSAITDAESWARWFPGVEWARYAEGTGEPGANTLRQSRVGGVLYDETMLVWEAPYRWGYRIDRTTAPIAHAQVEITELEPDGDGSRVIWRMATDPAQDLEYLADGTPFSTFLQQLHEDAMKGLGEYLRASR